MNELIRINRKDINGNAVNTVNARELHAFLEVKTQFSIWLKNRIEQYGFIEGQDYVKIELSAGMKMSEKGGEIGGISNTEKILALESMGYKSFGQQGRIEYAITLNMAKELAMVERNEKGKQARQYFIECERRANNPIELLNNPAQLRNLLANYSEKVIALENKVAEQTPKAEGFDRIANADGLLNLTNAAKSLNVRPKDLFDFLQAKKWIYRRVGGRSYSAYQDKIQCGYLTHKVYAMTLDDGTERIREQVVVTPRGLTKLASIVPREAVLV